MKNRIRPPVKIDADGRVIRNSRTRADRWRLNVPASITGTRKERLFFKTEKEAKQKAEELLMLRLAVRPDMVAELAKRGMSIEDGVRYALAHAPVIQAITVDELTRRFLDHRRTEIQVTERYGATLESYLKRIRESMGAKMIRDVTKQQIRDFLAGLKARDGKAPASPDTRNHYLETFRALFRYAVNEKLLSESPSEGISKAQADAEEIEILALDDVRKLLGVIRNPEHADVAAAALIQLFAAPRRSEIPLLRWDLVSSRYLRLDKVKYGTKKRATEIPATLSEWLTPLRREQGYVFAPQGIDVNWARAKAYENRRPDSEVFKALLQLEEAYTSRLERLAQAADVKLPKNVLRHTAITMRVNATGDIHAAARWAGNSPAIIEEHYLGVASPEDAALFYNLKPTSPISEKDL